MDLQECKKKFEGMVVIGDLHGDADSLKKARHYAKKHSLFLLSLGDLVDRGSQPFETVKMMFDIVEAGDGGLVIGNHDDKHYRHAIGNKVKFSHDAQKTLA